MHGPDCDPFSLWVAQQLDTHGIAVTDDTITEAKKRMIAANPDIEKEYQGVQLNIKTQKGSE